MAVAYPKMHMINNQLGNSQSQNERHGLVYVGFGYEHLLMAMHSAYTAKQSNPEISCTLITNVPLRSDECLSKYFDTIYNEHIGNEHNRDAKTRSIEYVECEKGAYIDCDTEIHRNLLPLFTCLDKFDIILKMNPWPSFKDYSIAPGVHASLFPFWNGGVVFFRNGVKAKKFFSEWRRIFHEMKMGVDQPALHRVVYNNPDIRVLSVNSIWNTFPADDHLLKVKGMQAQSRILHYRDAKEYPPIAKKLYEHHTALVKEIDQSDPALCDEITEVDRKYKFLSSFFYQNVFFRVLYLQVTRRLPRLGVRVGFDLSRKKYLNGGTFKNIQS